MLKRLFDRLSDQEKAILLCRYLFRMTLEDIGKDFGICRERTRQIVNKSFAKIRQEFTKMLIEGQKMPWEIIKKYEGFAGMYYELPLVRINLWKSRGKKWEEVLFSFLKQAREAINYQNEDWCELYKDESKILFQFSNNETKNSRKVHKVLRGNKVDLITVGLGKGKILSNSPLKVGSLYLLTKERSKAGYIDCAKPVTRTTLKKVIPKRENKEANHARER